MTKIKLAKIDKIKKFSEAKQKEYFSVIITDQEGKKYSGFGNKTTDKWNVGDEVEVEVTVNGKFTNFSTFSNKTASTIPLEAELKLKFSEYDERIKCLEDAVFNIPPKGNGLGDPGPKGDLPF